MPSYRSLLVLALVASTVAPVLAGEATIRPHKKNEGRALSHLELVERDKQPLEVPAPRKSAVSVPKSLSGKMKALIGAAIVVNGVFDWAVLAYYHNKYGNSDQSNSDPPNSAPPSPNSATPPSNAPAPQQNYDSPPPETYEDTLTGSTQQNSTSQSTSSPSTNNGPNYRREEHPQGRRSPVDIPSELYPESESRIDAVADGNLTYAAI